VTISADAHVRSLDSAERLALTGGQLTLDQASDVTGADFPGRTLTLKLVVKLRGSNTRKAAWTVTATSVTSAGARSTATVRYPSRAA
jgi:hypothetical protein